MSEHQGSSDSSHWLDPAHKRRICPVLRRKFPSLSEADVDDVWSEVQREFLTKWVSSNKLQSEDSIDGLLYIMADRRACDFVRRKDAQRRALEKRQEISEVETGPGGEVRRPEEYDRLEYEELKGFVIEAFRLLAPDEWDGTLRVL